MMDCESKVIILLIFCILFLILGTIAGVQMVFEANRRREAENKEHLIRRYYDKAVKDLGIALNELAKLKKNGI